MEINSPSRPITIGSALNLVYALRRCLGYKQEETALDVIMKKNYYLICYDITCPKRGMKIHKIVSEQAMSLQYSVFLGHLNQQELASLVQRLSKRIDEKVDDLRIYPINYAKSLLSVNEIWANQQVYLSKD